MNKWVFIKGSQGFTLVETLAGLVIISIILLGFFSFFGQSLLFSSKAEDSYSSTNLVDKLVHEVKENDAIENYLQDYDGPALGCDNGQAFVSLPEDEAMIPGFDMSQLNLLSDGESGDYYYRLNNKKYVAEFNICQTNDEKDLSLFRVYAKLKESDGGGSSDMIHYLNVK
ncbi:type IV pilus modification PilV family protein [Salipaludibacillus daqingensis]|uniref:type IV pilus modification PilV family protein n=1 Tax=Salipaludibacillus daqingensis TaxID=3041001 RepID=UPI00247634D8|nr:type II secretion system protein [Salipaludibacillus daqingensis]